MQIVIFTDQAGWHGRELKRAAKARGVETRYVALNDCYFDLSQRFGLAIPGFEGQLPDAAFVRSIAAGSFEQVTLRLSLLHALRELGVAIYNDARAIEKSVDKAMTSFLLHHAGVATPATWVTEQAAIARRIALKTTARGEEIVMKPLFGSQGVGLMRIGAGMTVPELNGYQGVAYLQRFIAAKQNNWRDWRLFVVGGVAVAAMERHGKNWINNIAQGARCEAVAMDPELATLAERAARVLDMDYAGVDLIRDHEDKAWVLEVNGIPAWQGLQSVTELNIARCLMDDLIDRRLARRQQAEG